MTDHLGLRCPWNGSKRWLAPQLNTILQTMPQPRRYIEPFVGSGAVSHLVRKNWPTVPQRVSDANPWLAAVFERQIVGSTEPLPHNLDVETYRAMDDATAESLSIQERAVRFAVCVVTAWGNRWKTEPSGRFSASSTPVKAAWCQPEYLRRRVSEILGDGWLGTEDAARACDWREAVSEAEPGDLVYLDAPYPETLGYGAQVWTLADGLDVIDWVADASQRGVGVLVTYCADFERLLRRAGLHTSLVASPTHTRTRRARVEMIAWRLAVYK